MNTASITIDTQLNIKRKAEEIARAHGLSINEMINSLLKLVIRDGSFVKDSLEKPTPYLMQAIHKALKQKNEEKISPRFHDSKEAEKWLNE